MSTRRVYIAVDVPNDKTDVAWEISGSYPGMIHSCVDVTEKVEAIKGLLSMRLIRAKNELENACAAKEFVSRVYSTYPFDPRSFPEMMRIASDCGIIKREVQAMEAVLEGMKP